MLLERVHFSNQVPIYRRSTAILSAVDWYPQPPGLLHRSDRTAAACTAEEWKKRLLHHKEDTQLKSTKTLLKSLNYSLNGSYQINH